MSLLTPEQALSCMADALGACSLPSRCVETHLSLGRVLAEPLLCPEDVPRFSNSAMDGFLLSSHPKETLAQGEIRFSISGSLQAGEDPEKFRLQEGQALGITTGSAICEGGFAVVPIERCQVLEEGRLLSCSEKDLVKGAHIRLAGEHLKQGEPLLSQGQRLHSGALATIANLGVTQVKVFEPLSLDLMTSGDELIEYTAPIEGSKVRNVNLMMVAAQAKEAGHQATIHPLIPDDRQKILERFTTVLEDPSSHALITSAGISKGPYDYVLPVLKELGAKLHFSGVRLRPGKPFSFLTYRNKPIFCLPGNPVSSAVTFHLLVQPLLRRMAGLSAWEHRWQTGRLKREIKVRPGWNFYYRAKRSDGGQEVELEPFVQQNSHCFATLAWADALMELPAREDGLYPQGMKLRWLAWPF